MAEELSWKVRRLPVIISFSLMRCLLSQPKVISCPSKCIIWLGTYVTVTELEYNTSPSEEKNKQTNKKGFSAWIQKKSERLYRISSTADLVKVRSRAEPRAWKCQENADIALGRTAWHALPSGSRTGPTAALVLCPCVMADHGTAAGVDMLRRSLATYFKQSSNPLSWTAPKLQHLNIHPHLTTHYFYHNVIPSIPIALVLACSAPFWQRCTKGQWTSSLSPPELENFPHLCSAWSLQYNSTDSSRMKGAV